MKKTSINRQSSEDHEKKSLIYKHTDHMGHKRRWLSQLQPKLIYSEEQSLDRANTGGPVDSLSGTDDFFSSSEFSNDTLQILSSSSQSPHSSFRRKFTLSCSSSFSGNDCEEDVQDWLMEDSNGRGLYSLSSHTTDGGSSVLQRSNSSSVDKEEGYEILSQLREMSDLQFDTLESADQLELAQSIEVKTLYPGDIVVHEGDDNDGGCFFLILGPENAQVEVVRTVNGSEEFLTRLGRGQYFGQKYFMSNRVVRRNASVRVVTETILGCVAPEHFYLWHKFRAFLLMKAVPLIRTLPQSDQLEMYSLLQHQEFQDGDYIIRQGDVGDKFYIIIEGAADIIEESWDGIKMRCDVLTRLYEGHFFGEMAIIYDEPRVASVVAVGRTACLYLSKAAFRDALTTQQFHNMMQNVAYERTLVRERREKTYNAKMLNLEYSSTSNSMSNDLGDVTSPPKNFTTRSRRLSDSPASYSSRRISDRSDISDTSDSQTVVTTTSVLVRKQLSTGDRFINKYLVLRELGRGSFGGVYLCRHEETDKLYAMKMVSKSAHKWNMHLTNEIKKEIAIMKNLRHPNVVSLLEVIDDPSAKQVYLIQEYMEGGPLLPGEQVVSDPLPPEKVWLYFRDMLRGVSYLHSQGVVHRDLKPQNMLRSADDKIVKIADFGAAVLTSGGAKLAAGGTPAFMAPELFKVGLSGGKNNNANSPLVDVWGLGATLYNMVFGRPPWIAQNQIQLAEMVQNIELRFPEDQEFDIDPHLRNLLKRMLEKDPKTRITMAEVQWHEWVTIEGTQPIDDEDIDVATYDARDRVSEVLIHEAIPEYIGAVPIRRLSGPYATVGDLDICRGIISPGSKAARVKNTSGVVFDALNDSADVDETSPSWRSLRNAGSPFFLPSSDSHRRSTDSSITSSSTICSRSGSPASRSAVLDALDHESDDGENECLSENSKRLSYTKHQEFVARPTEMVLPESGEVWKGVIITNAKNRNDNMLSGFNWTSQNVKSDKRKAFRRFNTYSYSSDANDSDNDDSRSLRDWKARSMDKQLSRGSSDSNAESDASDRSRKSKSTSNVKVSILPTSSQRNPQLSVQVSTPLSEQKLKKDMNSASEEDSDSDEEQLLEVVVRGQSCKYSPTGSTTRYTTNSKQLSELCDYVSDDEIIELDNDGLDDMLDSLCQPTQSMHRDVQMLPLTLDRRGQDSLFYIKTWAGQSNLRVGVRYGVAEIINGRDDMEDRTTAKASIEEEASRQKVRVLSGAAPNSSFNMDYLEKGHTEDFAFFGIYDGHEGSYVSEYLQQNLHIRFRQRLAVNGPIRNSAVLSFMEACSLIDDEVLSADFERMRVAKEARASMSINRDALQVNDSNQTQLPPPLSERSREERLSSLVCTSPGGTKTAKKMLSSLVRESGMQSFAGSTAIVAILFGGWPYEMPTNSKQSSPRSSNTPSSSVSPPRRLSTKSSRSTLTSMSSSTHSLIHGDTVMPSQAEHDSAKENTTDGTEERNIETLPIEESGTSRITNESTGLRPPVKLLIAHVGDCRAVLSESGIAVQLTMDHVPTNPVETSRIECAGGWVQNGRVNGVLGVSRSFGDIMFKSYDPKENKNPIIDGDMGDVWRSTNQVISLPETLEIVVHPTYEFLILASDGLWEKCSCVEAVNFIRRRLFEHGDAQRAAPEMVGKVESQGGSDNTSVLVICLNQLSRNLSPGRAIRPLRRIVSSVSETSSSPREDSLSTNTNYSGESIHGLSGSRSWTGRPLGHYNNDSRNHSFRAANINFSLVNTEDPIS